VERELVFDIDLTDYDDVRTCGKEGHICNKCWPLMAAAIKVGGWAAMLPAVPGQGSCLPRVLPVAATFDPAYEQHLRTARVGRAS